MRQRRYRTTLDRLGWSIAAAAFAGAVTAGAIALFGHDPDGGTIGSVAVAALAGALAATVATVALGLPLWWRVRRRADGPVAAGLLGLAIGWTVLVIAQTGGLGAALPAMDTASLAIRWASAALTATVLAPLAALVALVVWRVAYRRV